jgi:hypothetical protein
MKTKLILLTLISTLTFAHEGVERGPNGGRILEFSKNETMHGEVLVKGDKFHIAVLDKDMKPVAMAEQTLTATTGDRESPTKLAVEKDAKGFVVPVVKSGDWLILQFKNSSKEPRPSPPALNTTPPSAKSAKLRNGSANASLRRRKSNPHYRPAFPSKKRPIGDHSPMGLDL